MLYRLMHYALATALRIHIVGCVIKMYLCVCVCICMYGQTCATKEGIMNDNTKGFSGIYSNTQEHIRIKQLQMFKSIKLACDHNRKYFVVNIIIIT